MDGVGENGPSALWRRKVVAKAGNGVSAAAAGIAPNAKQIHKEVARELN